MDFTPRLGLPYIAAQQAQKQVTYNEAMKALDQLVQLAAKSRTTSAPPGSPAIGDTYIVPASATGGWGGKDHKIAVFVDGVWAFRTAAAGWLAYVVDSAEIVIFGGSTWTAFVSNGGTSVASFGINATADTTNRLAIASDASLFTHDGTDHRLKVDKSAAGSTASVIFQDASSGRAEFGLTGDDDFHVKVSADGSAWTDAMTVARTSGLVTLPVGQLAFPATHNPAAGANVLDDYEEGTWTPGLTFGGGTTGITYAAENHGRYVKVGKLVTAHFRLALSNKGSSTGDAALTGLPFTVYNNPNGGFWCVAAGFQSSLTAVTGVVQLLAFYNTATVLLYFCTSSGASTALTNGNFQNGSVIHGVLVYEATA